MSGKRIFGAILIFIGAAMLCGSGCLLWYNDREDQTALQSVNEKIPIVRAEIEKRKTDSASLNPEVIDTRIQEMITGETEEASPTVEIDGNRYIGILSLPEKGYETPIFSDWDMQKLKLSPCRYAGSPATHDFVVAGHNYKSSFGKLHSVSVGESISFTDMDGKIYNYTVGEIEILNPTDVPQMIESNWDLSLYTCTYGGKQRLTVRCRET